MQTLTTVELCGWCGARKGRFTCDRYLDAAFVWMAEPDHAPEPYDPVEELITSIAERRPYPEDAEDGPLYFGD
jgi:hypothetical protein